MVTVHFKLTEQDSVSLPVSGPETFDSFLQRCKKASPVQVGGYIAVRRNKVISGSDLVQDFDEIELFPALSGG